MKRNNGVTVFLAVGVLFAGCGGSGPPGIDPELAGTWRRMRPGDVTPKVEISFGPGEKVVVRQPVCRQSSPSCATTAQRTTFEGTYSVAGRKLTFESTDGEARLSATVPYVVVGSELAIGDGDGDDGGFVFLPKTAPGVAPFGSWVYELSTVHYVAGAVESEKTLTFEVEVQATGIMSWTMTERRVQEGVSRPARQHAGHGTWREISPGRYNARPSSNESLELNLRLLGGALVTDGAIFVRQ